MKKKIVVISGAGLDAESGISTFRSEDGTGLWNNFKVEEVCTATAFEKDPNKVNDFYNLRRKEMLKAIPNKAHLDLAEAEKEFEIIHITTNVSTLLEKAGCTNVLHLHGNLTKARPHKDGLDLLDDSLIEPFLINIENDIKPFQELNGYLLRPHIVFFEENVPNMEQAYSLVEKADYLIVVGTSLSVYPSNMLLYHINEECLSFYIDPNCDAVYSTADKLIKATATEGIEIALNYIKQIQ